MSAPTHLHLHLPLSDASILPKALRTAANHHHSYAASPTCPPHLSTKQTAYAAHLETLASDIEHIILSSHLAGDDAFLTNQPPTP